MFEPLLCISQISSIVAASLQVHVGRTKFISEAAKCVPKWREEVAYFKYHLVRFGCTSQLENDESVVFYF